jgi:hypothetical protein
MVVSDRERLNAAVEPAEAVGELNIRVVLWPNRCDGRSKCSALSRIEERRRLFVEKMHRPAVIGFLD